MENLVVSGIGLAAVGYAGYMVWLNINGKHTCNCGGSCQGGANCCSARSKKS